MTPGTTLNEIYSELGLLEVRQDAQCAAFIAHECQEILLDEESLAA